VQERVARAWLDRGVRLVQGYGMTEASPGVYMATHDGTLTHPTSVGVPHFFTDVALLRDGRPGSVGGEPAELLVRGPHLFSAYWNRPEETDAAFVDGQEGPARWFRTGDVVRVDDDGWADVVDRVKDMYISGGENVYPAEVEAVAVQLDAVANCAVVGVADRRWGEVGTAYVQVRDGAALTEAELRAHLQANLARYKVPKYLQFVPELPRNATGKIRRVELRHRADEEHGRADDHPTEQAAATRPEGAS
jgi:fatty-acyl-CoA synthase